MELYWNQYTIANSYQYADIFSQAFGTECQNISDNYLLQVYTDFPIEVPVDSESSLFNKLGAIFQVAGTGIITFGSPNPAAEYAGNYITLWGAIFSLIGILIPTPPPPPNTMVELEQRLSNIYTQITTNASSLLTAVMQNGDLSAYPSWIYSGSNYNIPLVAFFDNGRFFNLPAGYTVQALVSPFSNQLLITIVGTAVLEARYYILMNAYDVADCPIGKNLTGTIISGSCFTLEEAGPGPGLEHGTRADYSVQMDPITVGKLVDTYQVDLVDLYNTSYSCQPASKAYGTTPDLSTVNLNMTGTPPCFYNLPVFQVSPPASDYPSSGSPCTILYANSTGKTAEVGLNYLPSYLTPLSSPFLCNGGTPDPDGIIKTGNETQAAGNETEGGILQTKNATQA
jgi:hypothetical protein